MVLGNAALAVVEAELAVESAAEALVLAVLALLLAVPTLVVRVPSAAVARLVSTNMPAVTKASEAAVPVLSPALAVGTVGDVVNVGPPLIVVTVIV